MPQKLRGPNKWKKLDARFTKTDSKIKLAKKAGYKWISEAIVKEYRTNKSTIKVADKIGMTPNGVRLALLAFGEDVAPRGGRRKGAAVKSCICKKN